MKVKELRNPSRFPKTEDEWDQILMDNFFLYRDPKDGVGIAHYKKNLPEQEHLETPGDLEELAYLIQDHDHAIHLPKEKRCPLTGRTSLQKFIAVGRIFNHAWNTGIVKAEDVEKWDGVFKEIREDYPALWKTLKVWGWG